MYVCMYSIILSRNLCYLSFVIFLVDPPLCKRDFHRPTFVYKPGRNIISALSQKINIRALEILYNKGGKT